MEEILETALTHTLLGMGITFAVLIVISLLISLMKYLPGAGGAGASVPAPTPSPAPAAAPVEEEAVEASDDLELIAVITAAVAAAMGTTATDGFVVRSIKRRSGNHWKR